MKLDPARLAIAFGGATAVFWIICSVLVALFSGAMLTMSGHMLHWDMTNFGWTLTLAGFFAGLVSWTVCAAVFGLLIGLIYNALGGSGPETRA